ncbi:hypothetical protein ACJIZ3_003459 [Penstemon smallii]|uniref:Uncharacterized protein n=1 Tax=Penstemon smallii TaxID=265156 RepID=A0ABD3UAX8_9LAMI
MAEKDRKVIEIDDYRPSLDDKRRISLRPVCCAKNRDEIKQLEEQEDCFVIDFDPNDELDISNLSLSNDNVEVDLRVIAEKGQVACRDYPHPRHACAKFPFKKTPHGIHCKLCYCYVCDLVAPCEDWIGASSHCHAFDNESWNLKKKLRVEKLVTNNKMRTNVHVLSI